jgi:ATP-dependent exoDNAse (exonuclease V) beta subunit
MLSASEAAGRDAPVDDDVRRRIVTTLDRPIVVEAGAGTGKTTLLISRLLHALESGATEMSGVVAISFTEKAAAELRLRLRQALERRARVTELSDPSRARLRRALHELHRARISTIHAFASTILRERPAEARVDPQFRVLDELESLQIQRAFWRRWVEAELERASDDDALKSVLVVGVQLEPDLQRLALALDNNRDVEPMLRLPALSRDLEQQMRAVWTAVRDCREHAEAFCRDPEDRGLLDVQRLARRLDALDELALASWPAVFVQDLRVNATAGRRDSWAPGAAVENKARRLRIQQQLVDVRQAVSDGVLRAAIRWLQRFLLAYSQEKHRLGVLDFQDLLLQARALLHDDLTVRGELGARIQMLCVDEFQDTDPLSTRWDDVQVGSKLFLVGDPKQSIYRFRRADLDVYARCCDIVKRCGGEIFDVVQNFRSRPAILHWVNGVFAQLFDVERSRTQPRAVELVASASASERPAVWVVTPGARGDSRAGASASADVWRRDEARAHARLIVRALDERWSVRAGGETRPLEPRDVAVLFARTAGVELYEDALRAAGLPFRQEGGRLFFQRQEIRDVLHALAAIDDPQDSLALVAALRSPLFGISDEELWMHRRAHGGFSYLQSYVSSPLRAALDLFCRLHAERHTLDVEGCVTRLLECTSARAVYAARPHGERCVANFETLMRQARGFTSTRAVGLREFVRTLRDLDDDTPRLAEWSPEEERSDRVRLLTVHMAKGLEFPFVALANLGARGNLQQPPLVYDRVEATAQVRLRVSDVRTHLSTRGFDATARLEREREAAEERRLLYVAATRARDYLVVGSFGAHRPEGLLKMLRDVPGALGETAFASLGEPHRAHAACEGTSPSWCVVSADELPAAARRVSGHDVNADVESRLAARHRWIAEHEARCARSASRVSQWRRDPSSSGPGCVQADTDCVEQVTRRLLEQLPESADAQFIEAAALDAARRALVEARADEIASLVLGARTSELAARARVAPRAWRGVRLVRASGEGFVEAQLDLVFEGDGGCVLVHYTTEAFEGASETLWTALLQRAWVLAGAGRRVVEAGVFHLYESAYAPVEALSARLEEFETLLGHERG